VSSCLTRGWTFEVLPRLKQAMWQLLRSLLQKMVLPRTPELKPLPSAEDNPYSVPPRCTL